MSARTVFEVIRSLWTLSEGHPFAPCLPTDEASLSEAYARMQSLLASFPRRAAGTIDRDAIVRGEIVAMGEGSVIEAGVVIHPSCRLILGERSVVRSGSVLRDEVLVGDDCLVGAHSEVLRSVLLGPRTQLGHRVSLCDSILGRDVMVGGNAAFANTRLSKSTVEVEAGGERVDTGRAYFGALVGDGVRFGGSVTFCPGCIVLPGLSVPPQVVLLGTIDERRCRHLMRRFLETWGERGA